MMSKKKVVDVDFANGRHRPYNMTMKRVVWCFIIGGPMLFILAMLVLPAPDSKTDMVFGGGLSTRIFKIAVDDSETKPCAPNSMERNEGYIFGYNDAIRVEKGLPIATYDLSRGRCLPKNPNTARYVMVAECVSCFDNHHPR
jgi:hypothetical protein